MSFVDICLLLQSLVLLVLRRDGSEFLGRHGKGKGRTTAFAQIVVYGMDFQQTTQKRAKSVLFSFSVYWPAWELAHV